MVSAVLKNVKKKCPSTAHTIWEKNISKWRGATNLLISSFEVLISTTKLEICSFVAPLHFEIFSPQIGFKPHEPQIKHKKFMILSKKNL